MSLDAFQSVMTLLVANEQFRNDVRTLGEPALTGYRLTEKERQRALRLAADRGITVTATLVESFRLAKIVKLVPLTRTLLGDAGIGNAARGFWLVHPPRSFYAVDEVIAFCDYLFTRIAEGMNVPYLEDVVALERTMLELRRPSGRVGAVTRLVRFHHDPVKLLGALASGRVPEDVAPQRCALLVTVDEAGWIDWSAVDEGP